MMGPSDICGPTSAKYAPSCGREIPSESNNLLHHKEDGFRELDIKQRCHHVWVNITLPRGDAEKSLPLVIRASGARLGM